MEEENVCYIIAKNPEGAKEQKGLKERHIKELDEQLIHFLPAGFFNKYFTSSLLA